MGLGPIHSVLQPSGIELYLWAIVDKGKVTIHKIIQYYFNQFYANDPFMLSWGKEIEHQFEMGSC